MIKEINANARISFKQLTKSGDVYYTFEYGEVRTIEENTDKEHIEEEKQKLWNDVNSEINKQIIEVKELYK